MRSSEAADSESEQIEEAPARARQTGHYSRSLWLLTIFIPTLCSVMLCATQVGFRLSMVDNVDRRIDPLGTADYSNWPRIAFAPVAERLSTLIVEERAQTATVTTSAVESPTATPISTATALAQTASPTVTPSPDTPVPAETATPAEPTPTALTATSVVVVPTTATVLASAISTITETATAVPSSSPTSTPQAAQPPVAVFTANPLSGPAALNVVFTNFSSGVISSYFWNFGNNQTSSAASPTHTYSTPGTYLVTLTVTGPGGTSSATQTINVTNPMVDLQLTKLASASSVVQNQTFTYTLNVFNNSPSSATGVQIVDSLPAQVTLLDAPGCTLNGNTVTCFIGTLNPATSVQRVLTVRASTVANNVLNTATVFSSQVDSNIGNNSASAAINIQPLPQADIAIGKTLDSSNPNPGDNVTFTITATNNGPNNATNLRIRDVLPPGLTFSAFTATQGNYNSGTGRWNIGSLNNGASATLQLTVTVDNGTQGQVITTTASVLGLAQNDPIAGNNSASANITVQAQADLAITQMADVSNPTPGDSVIFTILVTNNGPDTATGIVITDVLPPGVTFISSTLNQGNYASDTWNLVDPLNHGSSAILQLAVTVNNGTAGQTITNTATISASDATDPDASNNTASANITVASAAADLEFTTFTFNNLNPAVGETLIASIVITNNGPATATNIVLGDSSGSGSLGSVQSVTVTHGSSAGNQWNIPSLNSGEAATMTITLVVDASAAGTTVSRWREIIASDQPDPDSTPGNAIPSEDDYNSYTVIVQPLANVDISITKAVDNPTPFMGSTVTYTITAANNGPDNASSVQVMDVLPPSVTYVSHTPTQGSYNPGTGIWDMGALNNGASASLTIQVTINAGTEGQTITNTAALAGSTPTDAVAGNNSASVNVNVSTGSPTCPAIGEPNIGPANGIFCSMPASDVVIDLTSNPIVTGPGYDLVYYERPLFSNPTIIHLDHMIIEVATSAGGPWLEVFNWGDGIIDANTNIGAAGYGSSGEPSDQDVPITNPPLYGVSPYITGIAIDVDARAGAGVYTWIRLRTSTPGTAFDALQVAPIP